jgi:hypothetical protein
VGRLTRPSADRAAPHPVDAGAALKVLAALDVQVATLRPALLAHLAQSAS